MAVLSYAEHDAVGLARLVADGSVAPMELVEAAIDQIERTNPAVNAVIADDFDRARSRAAGKIPSGPFTGVPILIKDLMTIAGERATFGSVFFRDYVAEETSLVMERILAAGFIPVGRTNTPEFGLLPTTEPTLHGPTRNPWDLRFSAGGSSGGAAAAVASGMVPLAHGSDGGGSIRIPASACGVFGFKPSRGRVPRFPASPADYLAVDLGVSRSVRDSAAMLDILQGAESGSAYWAPPPEAPFATAADADPSPLRIGYSIHDFRGQRVHPDCESGVLATVALLEDLGHEVVESAPPLDGAEMAEAFLEVWAAMAASVFQLILDGADERRIGRLLRRSLGDWRTMKVIARMDRRSAGQDSFEPFTWDLARLSRGRTQAHLERAKTVLQRVSHQLGLYFETHDAFLTSTLGEPPVRLGHFDQTRDWDDLVDELTSYVAFTPLANFSGLPAMSVPIHWSQSGLPVGTHIMGRFGEDHRMFQLAGQLERARPWADRRPAW
jgi:amidase